MKKLLLCACAALVLAACNDNDDQPRFAAENTKVENGSLTGSNIHFLGTSTVTSADGDVYVDPQSDFEFAGLRDFTLYMHRTRFAAAMPAMEMRLYAQPYTPGTGASLSFALPSVVPQVSIPNAVGGGVCLERFPLLHAHRRAGHHRQHPLPHQFHVQRPETGLLPRRIRGPHARIIQNPTI